jgi:hypothetical protein
MTPLFLLAVPSINTRLYVPVSQSVLPPFYFPFTTPLFLVAIQPIYIRVFTCL